MSKLNLGSLYQLTSVRFRLLFREPEAIFWIFVFPILLAGRAWYCLPQSSA